MHLLCQKHPELSTAGQVSSVPEPQADEGPFPQIFLPGMHVDWDVMA
jgi:hypothetical protein